MTSLPRIKMTTVEAPSLLVSILTKTIWAGAVGEALTKFVDVYKANGVVIINGEECRERRRGSRVVVVVWFAKYFTWGLMEIILSVIQPYLRCVGVTSFVFHVLQLLLIRGTQQNSYCISKSLMRHSQKLNWKLNLSWFSYDYSKWKELMKSSLYLTKNFATWSTTSCALALACRASVSTKTLKIKKKLKTKTRVWLLHWGASLYF